MTINKLTPRQVEVFRRTAAAMSKTARAAGEALIVAMRPVVAGLVEFGRKFSKVLNRLLKAARHKRRNLKKMNRKTRALALRR